MVAARTMALRQHAADIAGGVAPFHSRPSRGGFLANFCGPVVVMTSADDRAPGLEISAAQAAEAPKGRLVVVPGCGHYAPLERPKAVNAVLRDVLSAIA